MVLVGSLTYSQEPTPDLWINEVPDISSDFFKIPFLILIFHLTLDFPTSLFLSGFPTKTLYEFLSHVWRAACHAHLILLDFIIIIIFGKELIVNRQKRNYTFLLTFGVTVRYEFRKNSFSSFEDKYTYRQTDRYDFIMCPFHAFYEGKA
jgi:hypothetical protein